LGDPVTHGDFEIVLPLIEEDDFDLTGVVRIDHTSAHLDSVPDREARSRGDPTVTVFRNHDRDPGVDDHSRPVGNEVVLTRVQVVSHGVRGTAGREGGGVRQSFHEQGHGVVKSGDHVSDSYAFFIFLKIFAFPPLLSGWYFFDSLRYVFRIVERLEFFGIPSTEYGFCARLILLVTDLLKTGGTAIPFFL